MRNRATSSRPANRYQSIVTDRTDSDGWHQDPADSLCEDSVATSVTEELSRTIISSNQSPDVPFDLSINPYRGCEHGCIYCFARPTHAYWDMSPGLDFETRLIAKTNAATRLREALDKPGHQVKPIALGINTDAYQPIEKQLRLTREILEVLRAYRHPFSIITKGALILRDLDILSEMASDGLCMVSVSVTTLDNRLKGQMEPRAASSGKRLSVIRALSDAGVPTGVIIGPVIPFINDHEIERILEASAEAGAISASWVMLRLPLELGDLFEEWLAREFPERAAHVMARIRDLRGGRVNDSNWGSRMTGQGPYADLIRQRFNRKFRALGMVKHAPQALRTDLFRRPGGEQLSMF
mgnify:CR=1 FL=1